MKPDSQNAKCGIDYVLVNKTVRRVTLKGCAIYLRPLCGSLFRGKINK